MNISCIDPCTHASWRTLVNDYDSSVFHSPEWMQVLVDTYDLDLRAYLLSNDAGVPVAGIPVCFVDDIRGRRAVTIPFSDFCDPLVGNYEQWQQLTQWLTDETGEQSPYTIRCVHYNMPLDDPRLLLVNKAKWHHRDLSADLESHWGELHSSARRAVRKAKSQGVTIEVVRDKESIRTFFELHMGVRKHKYHLLAQPYRFFENIWSQFIAKGNGALMMAMHEGRVVGSTLFLEWQNTLYYKFNASAPIHLNCRPNDMVMWEAIQYGKERGYEYLDFGLSDWDQEGLIRYKRKFATEEKTISFLRYTPDCPVDPKVTKVQALLPQLTDMFTDESVPDAITEQAGDALYRFFC